MRHPPTYQITTAPAEAAAVFGMAYDFLRLEQGQEAGDVALMLNSAVEIGEAYTNRVFRLTSFTGLFPCLGWRADYRSGRYAVEIDKSPLVDVQAVRVWEEDAVAATTVAGTEILRHPEYDSVVLPADFDLTLEPDRLYPVEIDFRAGYSTGSPTFPQRPIPPAVSQALRMHVAYLYENRGDVKGDFADAMPDDVKRAYMGIRHFAGAA